MDRLSMLDKIRSGNKKFDFAVIGGGATGIGILHEAVFRGYSAILFEASDFTKSTSSKSTKLIHGGVRYLAQGNIGLVREACKERGRLKANAPHIVRNQAFIIPVYSFLDEIMYLAGLKFYDLLAGKFSLGPSVRISRKITSGMITTLKTNRLRGGIKYYDGQFDDSRLAISVIRSAVEKGGIAINYMPVKGLIKNEEHKIRGVGVQDLVSGENFRIYANHVINATGVFTDDILQMDQPERKKIIRPSQGVHLVVGRDFLPGDNALMIPKTEDGRVLFAVPWLGKVVIGTTDTPIQKASLEPEAFEEEIDFILRTAEKYLTKPPKREDVLSIFTGLRPLASTPDENKTKELSRSHKIIISRSELYTIIGGKWTTFRKMAEDLVNRVERDSGRYSDKKTTRDLKIFGYLSGISDNDPLIEYGTEAEKIRAIQKESGYGGMISEKLKISAAQIVYSIRYEMALNPEDVLSRRTRALFLDAREARNMVRPVAEIFAKELNCNDRWIEDEVTKFNDLAGKYILTKIPSERGKEKNVQNT